MLHGSRTLPVPVPVGVVQDFGPWANEQRAVASLPFPSDSCRSRLVLLSRDRQPVTCLAGGGRLEGDDPLPVSRHKGNSGPEMGRPVWPVPPLQGLLCWSRHDGVAMSRVSDDDDESRGSAAVPPLLVRPFTAAWTAWHPTDGAPLGITYSR